MRTNHNCERILESLPCDVVLVRNSYFMENWSSALETINSDQPYFYSTVAPLDYNLPMVRFDSWHARISANSLLL